MSIITVSAGPAAAPAAANGSDGDVSLLGTSPVAVGRLPSDASKGQLAICSTRVEALVTTLWDPLLGLARAVLVICKGRTAKNNIRQVTKRMTPNTVYLSGLLKIPTRCTQCRRTFTAVGASSEREEGCSELLVSPSVLAAQKDDPQGANKPVELQHDRRCRLFSWFHTKSSSSGRKGGL